MTKLEITESIHGRLKSEDNEGMSQSCWREIDLASYHCQWLPYGLCFPLSGFIQRPALNQSCNVHFGQASYVHHHEDVNFKCEM
jgi:hypothetical protein